MNKIEDEEICFEKISMEHIVNHQQSTIVDVSYNNSHACFKIGNKQYQSAEQISKDDFFLIAKHGTFGTYCSSPYSAPHGETLRFNQID